MPFNLFGKSQKPPDLKTLANWLLLGDNYLGRSASTILAGLERG
jgi:hypothetical protein